QNLMNRHCNRLLRYIRKCCEPPFPYLLCLTCLIKLYYLVGFSCIEVSWRIVKRNMCILTDSNQCDIDRSLTNLGCQLFNMCGYVSFTINQMGFSNWSV